MVNARNPNPQLMLQYCALDIVLVTIVLEQCNLSCMQHFLEKTAEEFQLLMVMSCHVRLTVLTVPWCRGAQFCNLLLGRPGLIFGYVLTL
jgi:hypothetical protein